VLLGQVGVATALLALWALEYGVAAVPRTILPAPWSVARALVDISVSGDLASACAHTAQSWLLGLAIALGAGNALGLLIGSNRLMLRSSRFLVDFVRSLPAVTLLPIALLLFGDTLNMKLVIIVFGATADVLIQAIYAARQVDPIARDTFRAFNASRWTGLWHLRLPSAAPFMATGARLAAVHALLLSVGAELVGGVDGIGRQLYLAQENTQDLSPLYAYIVATAAAGMALNQALVATERRLLRGHVGYR
jgi:ABC-type nitrate/sulfonate/bicarbonate transport system permease component